MLNVAAQSLSRRCATSIAVSRSYSIDPLEYKMAQKRAEIREKMGQTTQAEHAQQDRAKRLMGATEETGQTPSGWQKRFLVLTRVYKNKKEIPLYVPHNTMNQMHQRMRVLFIFVGVISFFVIFYTAELVNAKKVQEAKNKSLTLPMK